MSNDSKNLKNVNSVLASTLDKARTTSIVETMKKDGKKCIEIVKKIFEDNTAEDWNDIDILFNTVLILQKFDLLMGYRTSASKYNDGKLKSNTFLGYSCIIQHYTEREEAKEFSVLIEKAKTVRDLWNYFLKVNDIDFLTVYNRKDYNHDFFENILDTPFLEIKSEDVRFNNHD